MFLNKQQRSRLWLGETSFTFRYRYLLEILQKTMLRNRVMLMRLGPATEQENDVALGPTFIMAYIVKNLQNDHILMLPRIQNS
jgi:hypothetical protein